MTILADTIVDVAGGIAVNQIYIAADATHDATGRIIFKAQHTVPVVAGVFTTPDLESGPAVVTIGAESYGIVIPTSGTVRLGPLITAGAPGLPPTTAQIIGAAVNAYLAIYPPGPQLAEDPPGSGLYTSSPAMTESPTGSGLYLIGG